MTPFVAKEFHLYDMDENLRLEINRTCEEVARRLGKETLGTPLYYSVMELINNAVKANLKRIFFKERGYLLDDPKSYQEGLEAFRAAFQEMKNRQFSSRLKRNRLHVSVLISLDHTGILLEVTNNSRLLQEEYDRINEKLDTFARVDDIVDFYKEAQEEIEGKGLGILLILYLWRPCKITTEHFHIFNYKDRTVIKLHIPAEGLQNLQETPS